MNGVIFFILNLPIWYKFSSTVIALYYIDHTEVNVVLAYSLFRHTITIHITSIYNWLFINQYIMIYIKYKKVHENLLYIKCLWYVLYVCYLIFPNEIPKKKNINLVLVVVLSSFTYILFFEKFFISGSLRY